MRVSSKVKQSDLDKLVPSALFQEQSEAEKQAEKAQRELERSGNGFSVLRTEPKEPVTSTEAESVLENMLFVRDKNKEIPF